MSWEHLCSCARTLRSPLTNYGVILLRYAEELVRGYTKVLTEINAEKNRDKNSITLAFS
ncbi:MAG: hypothetical protein V8S87_03675 [Oscillospiraceae bacterium]